MLELIIHGGWAMWIIVGCSIVALAITFERLQAFRKANVDSEALLNQPKDDRGEADAAFSDLAELLAGDA